LLDSYGYRDKPLGKAVNIRGKESRIKVRVGVSVRVRVRVSVRDRVSVRG
jgi:hypothetical protein